MIAVASAGGPTTVPRTIEELTETVSASRLSTWQRCRLQFHFRYIAGIPVPTKPGLYVGKVIHAVLQAFNLARWRGIVLNEADQKNVFENVFEDAAENLHIDWNNERELHKKLAWAALKAYVDNNPIPETEKPAGVEVSLEADLAKHGLPKLVGVLDLVRPNGRIVDYKSTSRSPNQAMLDHLNGTQLASYGVLYREATGKRESGFDLHHLIKLKQHPKILVTPIGPMTDAEQTRFFRVIESYVSGLERKDFVPSPGIQCAGCEFLQECRAWH
jgi:CRISPR/Cas system-associated exonuclease Cas4 (RecB family)